MESPTPGPALLVVAYSDDHEQKSRYELDLLDLQSDLAGRPSPLQMQFVFNAGQATVDAAVSKLLGSASRQKGLLFLGSHSKSELPAFLSFLVPERSARSAGTPPFGRIMQLIESCANRQYQLTVYSFYCGTYDVEAAAESWNEQRQQPVVAAVAAHTDDPDISFEKRRADLYRRVSEFANVYTSPQAPRVQTESVETQTAGHSSQASDDKQPASSGGGGSRKRSASIDYGPEEAKFPHREFPDASAPPLPAAASDGGEEEKEQDDDADDAEQGENAEDDEEQKDEASSWRCCVS